MDCAAKTQTFPPPTRADGPVKSTVTAPHSLAQVSFSVFVCIECILVATKLSSYCTY